MNDNNPIKLISDECGMSVEEIIEEVGLSKEELDILDTNPLELSMNVVRAIEDATGVDRSFFMPKRVIQGPHIEPCYEEEKEDLIEYIEKARNSSKKRYEKYVQLEDEEISELLLKIRTKYEETAQNVLQKIKKPVLCAFGHSDAGKSTLINYLLGKEVAKTGYSRLTSAIVYYEHISDMPEYLKNDEGNIAFVFGKKNNNKATRKYKRNFSHDDVKDENKAKKHLISSGKFMDIINAYSTRKGENYLLKKYQVFEIVAYLDCDMLKELGYTDIQLKNDIYGKARMVFGRIEK